MHEINTIIELTNLGEQKENLMRDSLLIFIAEGMAERIEDENAHGPYESSNSVARSEEDFFIDSLEFLDDMTFFEMPESDLKNVEITRSPRFELFKSAGNPDSQARKSFMS